MKNNFHDEKRRRIGHQNHQGLPLATGHINEQEEQQQTLCALEQEALNEFHSAEKEIRHTVHITRLLLSHPPKIGSWLDCISSMSEEERAAFLTLYSNEQTAGSNILSCYRVIPLLILSPTDHGAKALLRTFDENFKEALEHWKLILIRLPSLLDLLTRICSRMGLVAFLAMDGLLRRRFQDGRRKFLNQFESHIDLCSRLGAMNAHVLGINMDTELALVAVGDMCCLAEAIKAYH